VSDVRTIHIGLLGLGNVGQAVAAVCEATRGSLIARGLDLRILVALVRDASRSRNCVGAETVVTADPDEFFAQPLDVVVEVIGGVEVPLAYVTRALARGIPVVTANKSLVAAHGPQLARLAARTGTTLRCEASAIAGVPFLGALRQRPLLARCDRVAAILNGTSNYVLTAMTTKGETFERALRAAQAHGYAEPDPSRDVSGLDAADKLVVILQHLGIGGVVADEIETSGIDELDPQDLTQAGVFGGTIKPIAFAIVQEERVSAFVGPTWLPESHSLARIDAEQNAVCLHGPEIGRLCFSGPGAGPEITAGTLLDDVVEVAVSSNAVCAADVTPDRVVHATTPATPWFIRIDYADQAPDARDVQELLASFGIWIRRISDAAREGRVYGITHTCARAQLDASLGALRAATGCTYFACRALED